MTSSAILPSHVGLFSLRPIISTRMCGFTPVHMMKLFTGPARQQHSLTALRSTAGISPDGIFHQGLTHLTPSIPIASCPSSLSPRCSASWPVIMLRITHSEPHGDARAPHQEESQPFTSPSRPHRLPERVFNAQSHLNGGGRRKDA